MTYFFKKPFGENGDITQIPTNDQGDGNVSYEKGWGEGYEIDPNVDPDEARNLSRTNFNGLFFNITEALQQLQIYGVNPYITPSDNDGESYAYPEGGMCSYIDPATGEFGIYRSLQSNNTTVPSINGVTQNLWQKEFDSKLDSIKSNRITNSPLYYYTNNPSCVIESDQLIITLPTGCKFLFADGLNEDSTYKNKIFTFENDSIFTDTVSNWNGTTYLFATSDQTILPISMNNYAYGYYSEDIVRDLFEVSVDSDIYYFDEKENIFKRKESGQSEFVSLDTNLCLFGILQINENTITNFQLVDSLKMYSSDKVEELIKKKENDIIAGRYLNKLTNYDKTLIYSTPPKKATPFCLNFCNLDANGNTDIVSYTTRIVNKGYSQKINKYGANGTFSWNLGGAWVGGGAIKNAFGPSCGGFSTSQSTAGTKYYNVEWTPNDPIYVQDGGYISFSANTDGRPSWYDGGIFVYKYLYIYFTDGSMWTAMNGDLKYGELYVTRNYSFTIPAAYIGKYISKIRFYCKNQNNWSWYGNYGGWYLNDVRLYIKEHDITGDSSVLTFKIGSNYLKVLNSDENAVKLIDEETGSSVSSDESLNQIWGTSYLFNISPFVDSIYSTYTFNSPTEETNNAKLFFSYRDTEAGEILRGLSITLTYAGGATYKLLENISIFESKDFLLNIPNGKYLTNIDIHINGGEQLIGCNIGNVQIYNNVSSNLTFTQYSSIYGTSGNSEKYYMLSNQDDIVVEYSGYLMLGEEGIYILPGTNVITKQKKEPLSPKEGDVWFDLSSEPLGAYVYQNGSWETFLDVPIGYVTVNYSNPSASATVSGTGITSASVNVNTFMSKINISGDYTFEYSSSAWKYYGNTISLSSYGITKSGTPAEGDKIIVHLNTGEALITNVEQYPINQNGYNINAFTQNIASIPGRDGRDGQNGKDGKNGAPGAQGPAGVGVPAGGSEGQALIKKSSTNYDTKWATLVPSGGTTGQVLAKNSNTNYDVKWANTLTSALFDGGTTGQTLIKNSNADLDFSWGNVQSLPSGGTTGQTIIKQSSTDGDYTWGTLESLPSGGSTGQALVKVNGDNYNVQWSTILAVPNGGTTGQTLIKQSGSDGDYAWETLEALPEGGTTGQSLVKTSGTDYDVGWETVLGLPSGGSTNYVLSKTSNTDYEVNWRACYEVPDKGLPGQVLTKKTGTDHDISWEYVSQETGADVANINFKTDIYFYASINQYTGVALEQFINMDGIATADQEDVLPYYYIPHKSILNSSEGTLIFDLKPINFGGQSLAIYLKTEHTDTVTFSYSIDNGTTFTSLSEEVNTPCSTTSLILRITMSAGSEVKNIGLLVK